MSKQALNIVIALMGLSGAAAAQTVPAQTAQTPVCAIPKIAGQTMDLKQVPGTNLMTAPVEINGAPKQFLLDISSDPDAVSAVTVAELHLPVVDQTSASDAMADLNTPFKFGASFYDVKGSGTPVDFQSRVRVASFSVAGATVSNAQLLVANDREMGKSEPYDGLLTASLFPQYDIDFDFGGKKMSFLDPTSCTDPTQVAFWPHAVAAVIPMTMDNGKIHVQVVIQGHAIDAVVDTGSDHTVMRRDIAERTLGLGDKDMTPDGDREDGMGQQIYVHTFPEISFAGVFANNVPARIQVNSLVHKLNKAPILGSRAQFTADPSQRIPDLALGMDVLHQLHMYAAFEENKLYVTPAS